MNEDTADPIIEVLSRRFGFEVRQKDVRPNQIRLLGRVPPEHSRNWVVFRQHILAQSVQRDWSYDGSRPDMLRGGAMVWGWRLIFQHEDIASQISSIVETINSCPRARFEVEEQALPGVRGPRTMMNSRGKGASSAGSVPLIVQQRSGGGVR